VDFRFNYSELLKVCGYSILLYSAISCKYQDSHNTNGLIHSGWDDVLCPMQ